MIQFKKNLTIISLFTLAVFSAAALFYLVVLLINWRDQPLSELSLAIDNLSAVQQPIADADNAYIYILGFSARQNEDPLALGVRKKQWLEQAQRSFESSRGSHPEWSEQNLKYLYNDELRRLSDLCRSGSAECIAMLDSSPAMFSKWLALQQWVLDRYEFLLGYKQSEDILTVDAQVTLPNYADIFEAQKLFYIKVLLLAESGGEQQVQALLEKDIKFWRMALKDSSSLISKLVIARAIENHFFWSNKILKKMSIFSGASAIPESWLMPFSSAELSMKSTLAGEWKFANYMLKNNQYGIDWSGDSGWQTVVSRFGAPFFQRQATMNLYAMHFKNLDDLFSVPLNRYDLAIENADKLVEKVTQDDRHIYNFTGEILFSVAASFYHPYFLRVANLEGVRRSALLVSEMRYARLQPELIDGYVTKSEYKNPYTDKPFVWDSKQSAIVFNGLGIADKSNFEFPY